jgi:integrase
VLWQASRKDVRYSTTVQHRTAVNRVLPVLGSRSVDAITPEDVQDLIDALVAEGKARETIRKSVTALAMVLDYARVSPNPARDRVVVKLPLSEPEEIEPPHADHVEAVAWILPVPYLVGLLALDATGARVGELEAARISDLDESRKAWRVRAAVSKTRRARWIAFPDDLYRVVVDRLPAREDRDPDAPLFPGLTADRLRMAIGRACRDAGVPSFSPHDLRHRRSASFITRASPGPRSGRRSDSRTSLRRRTSIRTSSWITARSTGGRCSNVLARGRPMGIPRSP